MGEQTVPRASTARWLSAKDGEAEKSLVEAQEPKAVNRAGVRSHDDTGREQQPAGFTGDACRTARIRTHKWPAEQLQVVVGLRQMVGGRGAERIVVWHVAEKGEVEGRTITRCNLVAQANQVEYEHLRGRHSIATR